MTHLTCFTHIIKVIVSVITTIIIMTEVIKSRKNKCKEGIIIKVIMQKCTIVTSSLISEANHRKLIEDDMSWQNYLANTPCK